MLRLSTVLASTAAFAMAATPAAALELPVGGSAPVSVYTGAPEEAAGWGYGRRRHRGGIDTGDVIAGVLVIGAIAAIAGSANSRANSRERERREEIRQRREQVNYRNTSSQSSNGIDRAVDMCVDQVERGQTRVDSVDNAARVADGWRVSGELASGEGWSCWIDNDGRIREVDMGSRFSRFDSVGGTNAMADGQLSDEAYARARAATRYGSDSYQADTYTADNYRADSGAIDADLESGPRPAYPGGPLPGEEGYEEAMGG